MALLKIKDFDPDYREVFGGYDIKGLDVYSDVNNEKIGSVDDLMVDEQGCFRYFVVDIGFWAFGKKVLLPVERSHIGSEGTHLYALGLTKDQLGALPEFNDSLKISNDSRNMAHQPLDRPVAPAGTTQAPVMHTRPLEQTHPLESVPPVRQAPFAVPQQGYPASNQPVPGYPAAPPPYPAPAPIYPPAGPAAVQGQPNYPTPADPGAQYGYPPNPDVRGMEAQNPSVIQNFEQRLRAKRMQSDPRR